MKKTSAKFWLLSAILIIFAAVSTAYVLFGFKWPVGTNVGYYINANTPQVADEDDAVKKAANSWSQINPAGLKLSYKGSTSVTTYSYNGLNTICWKDEGGSGTLATSWMWYSGNTTLETDMVFNDYYNWSTSGSDYDIQTVALHEFGHWIGLDHSSTGIMRANYGGIERSIDSDARAGFEAMYGGGGEIPSIKLNRSSLSFTGEQEKIFKVRNSGGDTLLYQITDNKQWISVSPESGSSTGEWDDIVVSVKTSGLSIGNYSGTISVTSDNAVNSPKNLIVYLTISEDELPSVSIISPQSGDVVSGKITIDVDANDDNGIKKVEFYVDNKLKKTDNHSPFRWSWDTTSYSSGHHTIKAKAYDTINQTAEDSIRVKVDQLPEISITSPSSGSNVFGNVTVKASVSDDVRIKKVQFYINGELEKTDSKSPYKYNCRTRDIGQKKLLLNNAFRASP